MDLRNNIHIGKKEHFQAASRWPAMRLSPLIIPGRSRKGRRTRTARKLRPTGAAGESVGSEGRNRDRMSLNCVRKIRNTCVNVRVVTQGERGPPGNNGDKGERGDDVSNKKKLKNR